MRWVGTNEIIRFGLYEKPPLLGELRTGNSIKKKFNRLRTGVGGSRAPVPDAAYRIVLIYDFILL